MKLTNLFSIFLAFILIISCSDDEQLNETRNRSLSSCVFNGSMIQGDIHNAKVKEVLNKYTFDSSDRNYDNTLLEKINQHLELDIETQELLLANKPHETFDSLNISSFSPSSISYYRELHHWIYSFGDNEVIGYDYSPEQLMKYLCDVSDRVDADKNLNLAEKELLQGSIAVLYSSFKLWSPLESGGEGAFSLLSLEDFTESSTEIQIRKTPCKCAIGITAWSDMWGFTISLGNPVAGAGASVGTALANANNFKDC